MLEKYSAALANKDEAAMNDLLHDDFKFTMHKSGNVLTKGDVIKWAMSGDIKQDKTRIVYENDEVGISRGNEVRIPLVQSIRKEGVPSSYKLAFIVQASCYNESVDISRLPQFLHPFRQTDWIGRGICPPLNISICFW